MSNDKAMTLEQVRDWHLEQVDDALSGGWESDAMGNRHQHMANAIESHLATRVVTDEDVGMCSDVYRDVFETTNSFIEAMRAALESFANKDKS